MDELYLYNIRKIGQKEELREIITVCWTPYNMVKYILYLFEVCMGNIF